MSIAMARYGFTVRMESDTVLPAYAGSLLRGQFGAALRRTACMTGMKECAPCPLRRTCPYPSMFESPPPAEHRLQKFSEVPNPYVIEPPAFDTRFVPSGGIITFGVVLVGKALAQLPLVIFSIERAFRRGIGRRRSTGVLETVIWEDPLESVVVWDVQARVLAEHTPCLRIPDFDDLTTEATLHLTSPLRLQSNGQPLRPGEVSPRKLVTSLLRRITLLFELHCDQPGAGSVAAVLTDVAAKLAHDGDLRWQDWTRYSSRQDREMTLGGVMGRWTLFGELTALLPILWLGQWTHVGKNTTMGLGRYALELG